METPDKPAFGVLMARIAEVFQYQLSPTLTNEYFKALAKYPLRQVTWAIEECITDCLFFPKPKEIITAMFHEKHEGDGEHREKPLALPEHQDPEVFAQWQRDMADLLATIGRAMPQMPRVSADEVEPPAYGDVLKREAWLMTEKHWRARWDLARLQPDMAFFREQIPEHYRIQFAQEDAERRAGEQARQESECPQPWE